MKRRPRPRDAAGAPPAPLRLPDSGLASDILASLARAGLRAAEPAPAPVALPRTAAAAARGPERLFAFADLLEQAGGAEETQREEPETWVTFTLGSEVYGMPVTHVQEILRVATITRVPRAPRPVRGITNLRGRVLVVLDTRVRLGLKRAEADERSRILVVQSRGRQIGLLVDAVQQVVRLYRSRVQPPPGEVMTEASIYVTGVYQADPGQGAKAFAPGSAGLLVILLDPDQLLLLDSSTQEDRRS